MTITENETIQQESPIEFTTTVLTRFKIRFPQENCDIKGGEEYHIYLENLSNDTVGKQGVDLPITQTKGGKLEFTLSHRLRKLFSVGDKVKVKVVSATEEFYSPDNFLGEKPNELTDFLGKKLSVVFLYRIGENRGLIASECEKEEKMKELESIEETYALLTPEKTRKGNNGRIKIQTEMYDDHAVTRFFIKMKKYNLFKQKEGFYPVDYYLLIKNQEPITVYVCLMVITTHGVYKFLLASKIVKEFERFLTSKLNIYTIRDKLYELEKKVEKIVYDSFNSKLRKEEEEIGNYFSTSTMLEIMDHSSSYVLKAILALNTNNIISRDGIEEYVEKEYNISDKEYITYSLLYLLEKGIIRRITAANGKTCFSLVKIDDKKK
ncbi:MAG: hypothetical protein K9W46_10675 [Candidatus Heimdallarchaeum endolithica]|uniref:H15 domain-containing protein n=1 Tax=Candidatus Heimdallarchaeum endolithica TaxID=2876572 RepID=A0A9Y1BPJ5_9ARCH|nr:MAG: hypothetical protein K9W46_10675 [Candidatus Heimdallarchaeum endolithica]